MKGIYQKYMNNKFKFDKKTMMGIIFLIVVIAGVFGFVYEFIFYYFNGGMKNFYYRGGNFLPWINIYAIGALLIYFLTHNLKKKPLKIFLISVLSSGVLELTAGFVMYKFCNGFRCWNYNTEILNFGNIGGFVCLRSVLFFGVSSLLLIYAIVPICYYLANRMDKKLFLVLSISLFSIIIIDEIYNLLIAHIFNIPRASDIYKQIGFHYVQFK